MIKLILIFILFACSISAQIRVELPSDSVLLKNYLQVAEEQVGVREATGKNDGTRIDDYLQSAGYKRGSRYPYCISGIRVDANNIYVGGFFSGSFAVINKSTKQLVTGYPTFNNPILTLEQSN